MVEKSPETDQAALAEIDSGITFFNAEELAQIAYIEAEVGTAAAREWGDAILENRQEQI